MQDHSSRHRVLAAVAGLVLAIAATACDSDDDAAAGGETLASFMGWDADQDPEASEARWREQEAQVQEAIRSCMAEQGFEYLPVDHSAGSFAVFDETDQEEHLRTRGFGITTWYGDDGMADQAVDEEWHDPNQEIVEAMSESERQAYYEALHGSEEEMREHATIEYDEETGEEIGYSFSGHGFGCEGTAREAVHGATSDTQAMWDELQPAFEELYERVQADPRMVERDEEWSRCMAEAGYDYPSQQAMHEQIWEEFDGRLQELLGEGGGGADPFAGWSEADIEAFFEERTDDEIQAFFEQAQADHAETIDQEALRELQQEEIDLAVTDHECRGGQEHWEFYQEVAAEYEAAFIAENRETLERLREAEGR